MYRLIEDRSLLHPHRAGAAFTPRTTSRAHRARLRRPDHGYGPRHRGLVRISSMSSWRKEARPEGQRPYRLRGDLQLRQRRGKPCFESKGRLPAYGISKRAAFSVVSRLKARGLNRGGRVVRRGEEDSSRCYIQRSLSALGITFATDEEAAYAPGGTDENTALPPSATSEGSFHPRSTPR